MDQAHEILAEGGREDFKDLTMGRLSTKQLRQIGHPYAKSARIHKLEKLDGFRGLTQAITRRNADGSIAKTKGGKPRKPQDMSQIMKGKVSDLPINIQTGRLRQGIVLNKKKGVSGWDYDLYSTAPHAKHVLALEGTKYMRARGLLGPKGELRIRYRMRHAATIQPVRRALAQP
jgi:hypothetical protein